MASLLKKLIGDERGSAIVEAAFTFPLLVTFGFGVFEFSNAFYDHQEITTGIRDAARYLARVPVPITGANETEAKNLAVFGGGANPRVQGWTTGEVGIALTIVANPINPATGETTYRGGDPLNNFQITIVTVTAAVPYPPLGFLTAFGLPVPTFNLAHTERSIGS
jgi:Flp pilus assembly protein TadG